MVHDLAHALPFPCCAVQVEGRRIVAAPGNESSRVRTCDRLLCPAGAISSALLLQLFLLAACLHFAPPFSISNFSIDSWPYRAHWLCCSMCGYSPAADNFIQVPLADQCEGFKAIAAERPYIDQSRVGI